jgi:hypothetical protein
VCVLQVQVVDPDLDMLAGAVNERLPERLRDTLVAAANPRREDLHAHLGIVRRDGFLGSGRAPRAGETPLTPRPTLHARGPLPRKRGRGDQRDTSGLRAAVVPRGHVGTS